MIRITTACLAALALALATSGARGAEPSEGGLQQEYFVRQQADEDVLIRVDGREALFESAIFTIEGERLIASGVPGSRLAPLFQYVPASGENRQLDLRITAPLVTDNSRFDMGLSRIQVHDERSARLAQAYRWLSFGLEPPAADTAANWSIKVNALTGAERTFRGFGMEELQLWAGWFATQLTFLGLGDNHAALEMADALLADPGVRRHQRVRLAALRLRAEVLAALRGAGELPSPGDGPDPVQAAAAAAASLATTLGEPFERAEALYLAGLDETGREHYEEALRWFQEGLAQADAIGADELSTRIREQLVEIHGMQGDVAATSEVLQAIESQLTEEGANDELARNLLAQGRILVRTYRYEAARTVLRQALEFERNSATRNQLRLELAEAAYAAGDLDEAWNEARSAVLTPEGAYRRRTPVLDVGRGIGILAGVLRARGDGAALGRVRQAQREALESGHERTLWAWERAQDELAASRDSAAVPWLRQVRDTAASPSLMPYGQLARLWLCRLGEDCPPGAAEAAHRVVQATGIPRHAVAAGWLLGAIQDEAGRGGEAADTLERVLRELIFLRYSVPGVLGDWYWRHLERVERSALAALRRGGDAGRQMLGLARLRWLRASVSPVGLPFDPTVAGLDTEAFRALLARRQWPGVDDEPDALAKDIRLRLEAGRDAFEGETAFLSPAGLTAWLGALGHGETVLDFDLSGREGRALVGTAAGVQAVPLADAARLRDWPELLVAVPSLDPAGFDALMARWGRRLLGPVRDRLGDTVYLAAGDGPGLVPFEAMAGAGAPQAFVRLASFPAAPGPAERLRGFETGRVFLAGEPTDYRSDYLDRLRPGVELGAVMDRFLGPGLEVVQGAALLEDEFSTPAFRSADLVHLAMPASIDLGEPNRSWLELSEQRRGLGRQRLGPPDLAGWQLRAELLVFSQARLAPPDASVTGYPASGRPPLVAQALAAGAEAVLVTLWSGDDAGTADFMGRFYDRLAGGSGPAEAVAATRREFAARPGGSRDWARYQLWLE